MSRLVVFLDDGGVLNDNIRRAAQWRRLVGTFFAPILGGTPAAWAESNRAVTQALFDPAAWQVRLEAAPGYSDFERAYLLDWLGGMCGAVGVARPPDDACVDLARRAAAWITRRVDAAFPGVVDAVRLLHAGGYQMHTASGESSTELAGYLEAMGVRGCFGRLYGPDLIDTFKTGPEYYARVLADAGVAPADALVVDDSVRALEWAAEVGARTVLVRAAPLSAMGISRSVQDLSGLPAIIAELEHTADVAST